MHRSPTPRSLAATPALDGPVRALRAKPVPGDRRARRRGGPPGCRAIAVDVYDDKLALAQELGADHVVDGCGDVADQVKALGVADVALVTVPSPGVMAAAHAALNPRWRLSLVGLPADNKMVLPVFETVLAGISVHGSLVGTRNDLAETFQLHAMGWTRVIAESRRLEDVNECFEEVLAGKVPARLVFDMT